MGDGFLVNIKVYFGPHILETINVWYLNIFSIIFLYKSLIFVIF